MTGLTRVWAARRGRRRLAGVGEVVAREDELADMHPWAESWAG